jgi:hypothetical protein
MTKRLVTFRQADLQRALRAATSAGLKVVRFEVDPVTGKFVIITDTEAGQQTQSPLDQWMASHARPS